MSFPWIVESPFENATTTTDWASETDTGSKLDIAHYSVLSRMQGMEVHFRGAYCMRVDLRAGDTNDHTLTHTSIDIADAATGYTRFYLYASKDFTATADDTFNIYELQQAGGTVEVSLGMRVTASSNLLEIGIGDGTAPTSFVTFERGQWQCIELLTTVSTVGAGVVTLFMNGSQVVTLTSQTHAAAIGQGVLGTQDTLSTTTGVLLFDQFVFDDTRIYPISQRYPDQVTLTKSGHVFVGQGQLACVALMSGSGSDNVLKVVDSDVASALDASNVKLELSNLAGGETVVSPPADLTVQRGCYISLSGTNPRALIHIKAAQGYGSPGRIKQHGAQWKSAPGGF